MSYPALKMWVLILASTLRPMIYVVAAISAVATGALFALAAALIAGIWHTGILLAIGVIGAALQVGALCLWYLYVTRPAELLRQRNVRRLMEGEDA